MAYGYTYVHASVDKTITTSRTNIHVSAQDLASVRNVLRKFNLIDEWNKGPFAFLTRMQIGNQKNSAKLILSILVREIVVENPSPLEFWFEVGGKPIRFGMQEFCLVTGLRFGKYKSKVTEECNLDKSVVFDGNFEAAIGATKLRERIDVGGYAQPDDHLKCIYVYVVFRMCGFDYRRPIPPWLWVLVDDLERFKKFPWGSFLANESFPKWKEVISISQTNIYGYACAFQWWAMEAFPEFEKCVATRVVDDFPRCVNWFFDKKPQNFGDRLRDMEVVNRTLEPSELELRTKYYRSFLKLFPDTTSPTFIRPERRSKHIHDVGQSSRAPPPQSRAFPEPLRAPQQSPIPEATPYSQPSYAHHEQNTDWANTFSRWGETFTSWGQQMNEFVRHLRQYDERLSSLENRFNVERDSNNQRFQTYDERFTRMETLVADYVAGRHSYSHPRDLRPTNASSGMGVADHSKSTYLELQRKKAHRYLIFKIDEKKKEVVVEKTGSPAESYEDFTAALPESYEDFTRFTTTILLLLRIARKARSFSLHGLLRCLVFVQRCYMRRQKTGSEGSCRAFTMKFRLQTQQRWTLK